MIVFNEITGEAVTIPDEPKRIVSLSPAITETLFELGLGDKVVGVTVYCHRPPETRLKPKVATYMGVLLERLKEVNPDLILMTTGVQRSVVNVVKNIAPTYPIPIPVTVYGILDFIKKVALITNVPERGEELALELMFNLAKLTKACPPLRTYVELEFEKPYTAGAHTYIDSLLKVIGLRNVFGNEPRAYFTPNAIPGDVDLVIYDPRPFRRRSSEDVINSLRIRGITAMHYLITEGDELAHHGPYLIKSTAHKITEVCRGI
ncbi:ABC transporter substrate-binding protein [Caldivirga sp.]|uniref:ABC transporter substrate-binding protein n=1 Tax=Caldivirga sp. TaxID=2080243 RepID=UPI003D0BA98C